MRNLKDRLPKEGGFTIIEVVLVLAIAGLIFLIVFLALPQLQKSRRDTQRRSDAGRLIAALETYAGNTNGAYPANIDAAWLNANMGTGFNDPSSSTQYTFSTSAANALVATQTPGAIWYQREQRCNTGGNPGLEPAAGARNIAILMKLEQGTFCQDNQ